MSEWIVWFFSNPIPYGTLTLFVGVGIGWIAGHSAKTRPYEIERDNALADLDAALWTIELKESRPPRRNDDRT